MFPISNKQAWLREVADELSQEAKVKERSTPSSVHFYWALKLP